MIRPEEPVAPIRILVVHPDKAEEENLVALIGQRSDHLGIAARLPHDPSADSWPEQLKARALESRAHLY